MGCRRAPRPLPERPRPLALPSSRAPPRNPLRLGPRAAPRARGRGPVGLRPLVASLALAPQMTPRVGQREMFIFPKQHQKFCCWHMAPRASFTSLSGRQPGGQPCGLPHPWALCKGGGAGVLTPAEGGRLQAGPRGRAVRRERWHPAPSGIPGLSVQPPRGAWEASQGHISLGLFPLGTAVSMGSSVCRTEWGGRLRGGSGGPHREPCPCCRCPGAALIPHP